MKLFTKEYHADIGGFIMLFFQDAGSGIIPILIVLALIIGIVLFVIYYVVKAVGTYYETVNQTTRKKPATNNKKVNVTPTFEQEKIQLLICPQCNKTYSDLSQSFCLEDGQLLRKTSVSMPPDPEETVISGKFR